MEGKGFMKQPKHTLDVFRDGEEVWIDIRDNYGMDSGFGNIGIGKGLTERAAWIAAVKRLKSLTKKAEARAFKSLL